MREEVETEPQSDANRTKKRHVYTYIQYSQIRDMRDIYRFRYILEMHVVVDGRVSVSSMSI